MTATGRYSLAAAVPVPVCVMAGSMVRRSLTARSLVMTVPTSSPASARVNWPRLRPLTITSRLTFLASAHVR